MAAKKKKAAKWINTAAFKGLANSVNMYAKQKPLPQPKSK
jgi:hypothetical protein